MRKYDIGWEKADAEISLRFYRSIAGVGLSIAARTGISPTSRFSTTTVRASLSKDRKQSDDRSVAPIRSLIEDTDISKNTKKFKTATGITYNEVGQVIHRQQVPFDGSSTMLMAGSMSGGDPQSFNRYTLVGNRPKFCRDTTHYAGNLSARLYGEFSKSCSQCI